MMHEDKLRDLVRALSLGTRKRTVTWSETTDEDVFRSTLRSGMVRIEKYEDPSSGGATLSVPFRLPADYKSYEGEVYSVVVLDENNRELARYIPRDDMSARNLHDLWEAAKDSARNSEQKLNDMLNEVRSKV